LGLSWKAKLPQEVLDIWQPWAIQIQQLNGYSFERTLIPGENPEKENKQIHIFADASQDTYAAVAYMRSENRGKVSVRFIQARSRIKPVKATHTVPRMELLSIELGLSLLRKLRTTFDIPTHDVFIWTDSRACHDWIRIEARSLQIFIKNRVLKIRQYLKLDQVRWLPGAINPADAATRGITVAELRNNRSWLHGPSFLYNQHDEWPAQPDAATDIYAELLPETLEGVKRDKKYLRISQQMACTLHLQPATDQYYAPLNENLLKYSTWAELRRVVATCLRWRNKKRGIINPVEIWEAEEAIIGLSQSQCYRASLAQLQLENRVNKDNALAPLAPFLDKRGLIRLGGRTEASHLNYNAKYPCSYTLRIQ
jgi:ribonuclease HI